MNKQRLRNTFILSLLLLLGLVYSAQVFVNNSKTARETAITNTSDDNAENGEENLKETSHLFVSEKTCYHLKPVISIEVKLKEYTVASLPETYLQLKTPPPDFA